MSPRKPVIERDMSVEQLAGIVSGALTRHGITAVMTGGAVVSIYTDNEYQSYDLDFITHATGRQIEMALKGIGFSRKGRFYRHAETKYHIEFPAPPLEIGDMPIRTWTHRKTPAGTIHLLTPTQSVMDRLASYYHWGDTQSLEQAVLVARRHKVDRREIRAWSIREGKLEAYRVFAERLKESR